MYGIEREVSDFSDPATTFGGAYVYLDDDGDPVVDVRKRTGLWVTPDTLRGLADELDEVLG